MRQKTKDTTTLSLDELKKCTAEFFDETRILYAQEFKVLDQSIQGALPTLVSKDLSSIVTQYYLQPPTQPRDSKGAQPFNPIEHYSDDENIKTLQAMYNIAGTVHYKLFENLNFKSLSSLVIKIIGKKFNKPAPKKELKSPKQDLTHVIQTIRHYFDVLSPSDWLPTVNDERSLRVIISYKKFLINFNKHIKKPLTMLYSPLTQYKTKTEAYINRKLVAINCKIDAYLTPLLNPLSYSLDQLIKKQLTITSALKKATNTKLKSILDSHSDLSLKKFDLKCHFNFEKLTQEFYTLQQNILQLYQHYEQNKIEKIFESPHLEEPTEDLPLKSLIEGSTPLVRPALEQFQKEFSLTYKDLNSFTPVIIKLINEKKLEARDHDKQFFYHQEIFGKFHIEFLILEHLYREYVTHRSKIKSAEEASSELKWPISAEKVLSAIATHTSPVIKLLPSSDEINKVIEKTINHFQSLLDQEFGIHHEGKRKLELKHSEDQKLVDAKDTSKTLLPEDTIDSPVPAGATTASNAFSLWNLFSPSRWLSKNPGLENKIEVNSEMVTLTTQTTTTKSKRTEKPLWEKTLSDFSQSTCITSLEFKEPMNIELVIQMIWEVKNNTPLTNEIFQDEKNQRIKLICLLFIDQLDPQITNIQKLIDLEKKLTDLNLKKEILAPLVKNIKIKIMEIMKKEQNKQVNEEFIKTIFNYFKQDKMNSAFFHLFKSELRKKTAHEKKPFEKYLIKISAKNREQGKLDGLHPLTSIFSSKFDSRFKKLEEKKPKKPAFLKP